MEFDLGHGYEDASTFLVPEEMRSTLWVFGVLDEFMALGLVDVAGDSPLRDREQRLVYRKLRDSGYAPGISEVAAVMRRYSVEMASPQFLRLFQEVIDKGMPAFKRVTRLGRTGG